MKVYGQLEKAQAENTTSDAATMPKGMITYRTDTNVFKVSNGTIFKEMVDLDTVQTLASKTLTTPQVNSGMIIQQITTPANPSAGFNKLYTKSDGFFYGLTSAGVEDRIPGKLYVDALATPVEYDAGNSGAAKTLDFPTNGAIQKVTMTANCTFTFTAPVVGTVLFLKLVQSGAGAFTYTWPASVKWAGGLAPTGSATGKTDIMNFYYDGTNYFGSYSTNY